MENQELLNVLYDKTYECPACGTTFTSKGIRSGKNKSVSTDTDLYSHYSIVNPLIYDVVVCIRCGYASLSNNFSKLRATQMRWIQDQITAKYTPTYYPEILSEEDAINRYKLALLNAIVKKSRIGERAYLCLKIGWLYRDLEDVENEMLYLNTAKDDFKIAFSSERFPIFELDEMTTMYIIAALSLKSGEFDQALRWVSDLILKSGIPSRLKQRAQNLKEDIRAEAKANRTPNGAHNDDFHVASTN